MILKRLLIKRSLEEIWNTHGKVRVVARNQREPINPLNWKVRKGLMRNLIKNILYSIQSNNRLKKQLSL